MNTGIARQETARYRIRFVTLDDGTGSTGRLLLRARCRDGTLPRESGRILMNRKTTGC